LQALQQSLTDFQGLPIIKADSKCFYLDQVVSGQNKEAREFQVSPALSNSERPNSARNHLVNQAIFSWWSGERRVPPKNLNQQVFYAIIFRLGCWGRENLAYEAARAPYPTRRPNPQPCAVSPRND
jgi:hypothetical protein